MPRPIVKRVDAPRSTLPAPRARRGFTLIELLTVIAIIAILAALLFPTIAAVRNNAYQSSCMSNMHSLLQAMEMYKDDWRVYPDALYGYAPPGSSGCNPLTAPAPGQTADVPFLRLYPNYVKDRKVFTCPRSPFKQDRLETVTATNMMSGQPAGRNTPGGLVPYCYTPWDSYDFQYRPSTGLASPAAGTHELRYNRAWASFTETRQLVWRSPPDTTVVTWCLYHTNMQPNGNPTPRTMAVVAFKSGRVQTIPVEQLPAWSTSGGPWQTFPKP
jgi:prepilin-type N-terminal cleavage/methylation domain-containing protein